MVSRASSWFGSPSRESSSLRNSSGARPVLSISISAKCATLLSDRLSISIAFSILSTCSASGCRRRVVLYRLNSSSVEAFMSTTWQRSRIADFKFLTSRITASGSNPAVRKSTPIASFVFSVSTDRATSWSTNARGRLSTAVKLESSKIFKAVEWPEPD